ncbi:hypothetical protein LWI29_030588 [Acer saccharum]|uniref:Uncharacterized protein n=1 Tax=Acer saccharum TaxID=4024 RepID=A0AA39SXR4_ACESA|nr:hypothetical protein LWI29_030588 [Acer saccharum]
MVAPEVNGNAVLMVTVSVSFKDGGGRSSFRIFVLETNTLWFWKHLAHGCNVQNTGGALSVLVLFLLRSFILPKAQIPVWWSWGYLINQGLRQCYQLRCK